MTNDDLEKRIGRLELDMAGVKQRVDDLRSDVRELTPLLVTVAEIKLSMGRMQTDIHDVVESVGELKRQGRQQNEDALKDSRQWRRALILGSFTVLAALITAVASILAVVVA